MKANKKDTLKVLYDRYWVKKNAISNKIKLCEYNYQDIDKMQIKAKNLLIKAGYPVNQVYMQSNKIRPEKIKEAKILQEQLDKIDRRYKDIETQIMLFGVPKDIMKLLESF